MNEELKQKLTERFEAISAKAECDNEVRDALLKAYLAGGEYGYQYAVDKIFKSIEDQAIFGWIEDIEVDKFLEKIRKAMEE